MIDIKFDKDKKQATAFDNDIQIGECNYREKEETWNIIHTEVNKLYQGQGIARQLVETIIEKAKENNKNIIAECSYAKKVLESK